MAVTGIPNLILNDGHKIPQIAYGCGTAWYKAPGSTDLDRALIESLKTAIRLGYRHFDAAEVYGTEAELGIALQESGIPREEFYITTKVLDNMNDIEGSFETSLKKLQLEYLDLYLIHAPFFASTPEQLQAAWSTMEAIHSSGRAKSIGVSSFLPSHLTTILQMAKVRPVVNQVEFHPYLDQSSLLSFCKQNSVLVSGFAALTSLTREKGGPVDEAVRKIAEKKGVSESMVLLAWVTSQGLVCVTTSGKEERLREVLETLPTVELDEGEIESISAAGRGWGRVRNFFGEEFRTVEGPESSKSS